MLVFCWDFAVSFDGGALFRALFHALFSLGPRPLQMFRKLDRPGLARPMEDVFGPAGDGRGSEHGDELAWDRFI